MKKLRITLLYLCLPILGFSQQLVEGGVIAGYSNYLGDLVEPAFTLRESNLSYGIWARKNLKPNIMVRANLIYGQLSGDDKNFSRNTNRDISFVTDFVELSAVGEYDLFGNRRYDKNGVFSNTISPYGFFGLGLIFTDPNVAYRQENNPDLENDYSKIHLSIPIGIGVKMDLNYRTFLGLEWGMRYVVSDYLDGVKLSGDPSNNDVYFMGGLTFGRRFQIGEEEVKVKLYEY